MNTTFGAEFLADVEAAAIRGSDGVPGEIPSRWPVHLGGPGDLWMINI